MTLSIPSGSSSFYSSSPMKTLVIKFNDKEQICALFYGLISNIKIVLSWSPESYITTCANNVPFFIKKINKIGSI